MRQKSVVYSLEEHNQFLESKEKIKQQRQKEETSKKKETKEGQSEFRIEKTVGRQVITK